MPAKSKAQFRYMEGVKHGTIKPKGGLTRAQAAEFVDKTSSYKGLPERKSKKK